MLSQAQKKYMKSLRLRKYRVRHGSYLVEGNKICKEIVLSQPHRIKSIYSTADWNRTNEEALNNLNDIIINVTLTELGNISNLKSPPPVIIELTLPQEAGTSDLTLSTPTFYLDRIQDPGNLGTIIRICDWFGMGQLILSEGCADPMGAKVIQSAMASHARVQIIRTDIPQIQDKFPQACIWAADMGGRELTELATIDNKTIIIIGNEGQGVDPNLLPYIDQTISISGRYSLGAESLNAAITAGIMAGWVRMA